MDRWFSNVPFSIRWKIVIAFLAVLALAFVTINVTSLRMMEDYLINQRVQEQQKDVDRIAALLAQPLWEGDAQRLFSLATAYGREMGGRVLVMDGNAVVQVDPFSQLNGRRLAYAEVTTVLSGQDRSYGFHMLDTPEPGWVVYYTALIAHEGNNIGVLLFSLSVQDVVAKVENLRAQMMLYTIVVAVMAAGLGFIITTLFVRPFSGMMQVTQQVASGQFDKRLPVTSRDELGQLARSFNVMSERLENLDQSRNEFVSNASHELKTPLSAMKVLVESLLFDESNNIELYQEFLGDINQEIDRLNAIIQGLLTLVRMDSQDAQPYWQQIDMGTLLQNTIKPLLPLAAQRGIAINLALRAPVIIAGDRPQLQQVVINLVDNAIKYTHDGGVIHVQLWQEGVWCRIAVADNGPGIPQESLDRLFERFYRVDKARARNTGGTGLGLSIVHRIVLAHSGSITVESEEGKGSTFHVMLPLTQKDGREADA